LSMQVLVDLIKNNQAYLVSRILHYAKLYNYVKYTSTLEEAWIASVKGLSGSLIDSVEKDSQIPEIFADHDFSQSPISSFGVIEAQKHRNRGITLEMFLSLMKYYRQAYLDLVRESIEDSEQCSLFELWINRYFDHNEISYCSEWNSQSKESLVLELQNANRNLVNEKNKYLTIFESMSSPAIVINEEFYCIHINYAAQQMINKTPEFSGFSYYSKLSLNQKLNVLLPWLFDEFKAFYEGDQFNMTIEKEFDSPMQGLRNLSIKFSRMLDVSDKFEGAVILFHDLTEHKKIEQQLRHLGFHDGLTDLYNRTYMDEEMVRFKTGRFNPVGFISIDVDGLKLVNDNFGHHAGDELLINIAKIIRNSFRESDIAVRMGGDEFAVIMPLCTEQSIKKACKKIAEQIDKNNEDSSNIPISISIGWSMGSLFHETDIKNTMREADAQMYENKRKNHAKYESLFTEKLQDPYGLHI